MLSSPSVYSTCFGPLSHVFPVNYIHVHCVSQWHIVYLHVNTGGLFCFLPMRVCISVCYCKYLWVLTCDLFFKNYITFLLSALSEFPSRGQISIRCLVPALSISKQPQHQAPYLTTGHTSRMYRIDRHRRWPEALAINHRLITAQHETAQHGLHPFFGFTLAQLRRTTECGWCIDM